MGCSSLKVVKFGSGLKTLGKRAFLRCSALIEFVLPDTIAEIGDRVIVDGQSLLLRVLLRYESANPQVAP
jgi:hypothetical protein